MTTTYQPAPIQLRDFITATRPDWDQLAIQQAIDRARGAGWAYEHFVGALWRTACDPQAGPRDVDHHRPRTPARPESWTATSQAAQEEP